MPFPGLPGMSSVRVCVPFGFYRNSWGAVHHDGRTSKDGRHYAPTGSRSRTDGGTVHGQRTVPPPARLGRSLRGGAQYGGIEYGGLPVCGCVV